MQSTTSNGTPGNWQERLKTQLRADRQEYENLMREQLRELASSCSASAKKELDTIGSVIQKHSTKLNGTLSELDNRLKRSTAQFDESLHRLEERLKRIGRNEWKRSLAYFLAITMTLVTICGGSWGLMRYQAGRITVLHRSLEALRREEQAMRANLASLESKGGGLKLNRCGGKAGQAGRLCVKINREAGTFGANNELWMIPEGY